MKKTWQNPVDVSISSVKGQAFYDFRQGHIIRARRRNLELLPGPSNPVASLGALGLLGRCFGIHGTSNSDIIG